MEIKYADPFVTEITKVDISMIEQFKSRFGLSDSKCFIFETVHGHLASMIVQDYNHALHCRLSRADMEFALGFECVRHISFENGCLKVGFHSQN